MKVSSPDIELPELDRLLAHTIFHHKCIYDKAESNVIHHNEVPLSVNIKNTAGQTLHTSYVSNRTFRVKGVSR